MGQGRGLGQASRRFVGRAELPGRDRLDYRSRRRVFPARGFWGPHTGPSPTDRAKNGVKTHALTDSQGVPLAVTVSAGNRHDVTQLLPLIDSRRQAPVTGRVGRPRGKTDRILADRGYDYDKYRRQLRARGIVPVIARRCTENGSGLGRERWVVERTISHLHQPRRLRQCYERSDRFRLAFLKLRACQLCFLRLQTSF
jgi:transposase